MSKAFRGRAGLAAAALLLFAGVIATRLPASWLLAAVPKINGQSPHCDVVSGTIWHGACSGLTVGAFRFSFTQWELAAWPLLRGIVAAHLVVKGDALKIGRAHV